MLSLEMKRLFKS